MCNITVLYRLISMYVCVSHINNKYIRKIIGHKSVKLILLLSAEVVINFSYVFIPLFVCTFWITTPRVNWATSSSSEAQVII